MPMSRSPGCRDQKSENQVILDPGECGIRDETERRLTTPKALRQKPPCPTRIAHSEHKGLAFPMEQVHIRRRFPRFPDTTAPLTGRTGGQVHVPPDRSWTP